jgi:hypothetical protein
MMAETMGKLSVVSCQLSVVSCRFSEGRQCARVRCQYVGARRTVRKVENSFGNPLPQCGQLATDYQHLPPTTGNWRPTTCSDTDTFFLTQRFLNGLAELFALNPTFRFFRNDFHDRPHLGFRGRPGFGYGVFHQLINFIFFERLREILR